MRDLDSSMPFSHPLLHLHTEELLSLRMYSPSGESSWFSMESLKAPLQDYFPFCLGTDRASPVVTYVALVHTDSIPLRLLKTQDLTQPHLTQASNPKYIDSCPHPSFMPSIWLAVLVTGLGLQALGLKALSEIWFQPDAGRLSLGCLSWQQGSEFDDLVKGS